MTRAVWREFTAPAAERGWSVEARVRGIAGTFVLGSLGLAVFVDQRWLWLTAFVGANLLQSSLTGWCLMSNVIALSGSSKASASPSASDRR